MAPQQTNAGTVAEILDHIEITFPGIKDYIVNEQGQLRKHVNIFIGNSLISDKMELSDPVKSGDEVYIMQALSGG